MGSMRKFLLQDNLRHALDLFKERASKSDMNWVKKKYGERWRYSLLDKLNESLLEAGSADGHSYRHMLDAFADAELVVDLSATIGERGHVGKQRTVLLKDLCLFGCPFVVVDHVWTPYSRHWELVEPFFQGQEVLIRGMPFPYTKEDGTHNYGINLERVIKLKTKTK